MVEYIEQVSLLAGRYCTVSGTRSCLVLSHQWDRSTDVEGSAIEATYVAILEGKGYVTYK